MNRLISIVATLLAATHWVAGCTSNDASVDVGARPADTGAAVTDTGTGPADSGGGASDSGTTADSGITQDTGVNLNCIGTCSACATAWAMGCARCPNDPDCDSPGDACRSAQQAEMLLGCQTCAGTAQTAACDGQ